MHQWFLSNPAAKDAQFVSEDTARHSITRPTAYHDLRIVKALLPFLQNTDKEFHRWRFREMVLRTFEMAERRKDARTMERCAATYAKYETLDREDSHDIPVDQIVIQQFTATDDPSVLGIKPIPDIRAKQKKLLDRYIRESETSDILDIQYEDADLDEDILFGQKQTIDNDIL